MSRGDMVQARKQVVKDKSPLQYSSQKRKKEQPATSVYNKEEKELRDEFSDC